MPLQLTIVTPAGQSFDGEVQQVVLPGAEGEFGVLEAHERFLAPLKPGAVEIQTSAGSQWAALSDGFADVSAEAVVVLVSRCDLAADIDAVEARREHDEAAAALRDLGHGEEDAAGRAELEAQVEVAAARVEVAGR